MTAGSDVADTAGSGGTSGGPTPGRRSAGVITLALCSAGIVVALMQTLVIPIIPELPALLHTSASNASWAVTATLLAAAVFTPVTGRLGDMYGKRRVLLALMAVLVAGSLLCALTGSLVPVVIGRVLQGSATGAIPLGISIMRDELPPERLVSAMAVLSATLGVGGAIGLPVAAVIAEQADWRVLFWMSGGLGVVCGVLVWRVVPESPLRTPGRFDVVGALGLVTGLTCLLLAISKGGDWGWTSVTTLSLFAVAVTVLLVWGVVELRTATPLVDLRVSARRQVLFTNLASVVVGFALYVQALVLPQLLQAPAATGYGLGQSIAAAGLCLAPSGLVSLLVSPVSARLSARFGPKVALMSGIFVLIVGYGLGLVLMSSVWQIILISVVIGTGIALAYAAMPALIMRAVPLSETGAANGLNALMRFVGTATSSAVVSVVLAHMTTRLGTRVLPSQNGLRVSMAIAAVAMVAGFCVASFIPGRRRVPTGPATEPVLAEAMSD